MKAPLIQDYTRQKHLEPIHRLKGKKDRKKNQERLSNEQVLAQITDRYPVDSLG